MAIRAAAAKLFADIDYVISPVSPVVNFPAELASPLNDPDKPFEHICYTVPWNMSENPAASINGGYDNSGFPIGVQIVGRRFDDLGVLGMAKAFEGLRGPQKPWPKPPKNSSFVIPGRLRGLDPESRIFQAASPSRARNDGHKIKTSTRRKPRWRMRRSNTRSPSRS